MPKRNKVVLATVLGDSLSLQDKLQVPTERKFKPETGQMIAPCTIARVGIMNYRAGDCIGTDKDGNTVNVFPNHKPDDMVRVKTTEASLFDAATLESARSAPVTIGHPTNSEGHIIDVDATNSKELQKGSLEGMPSRLGDELSATIVINDAATIAIVQEQADELSIGQTCDLVLADEADDWDAEKVNIRINHVAIVRKGRAQTARISDEALDVPTPTLQEISAKFKVEMTVLSDALAKGILVELEHTTDKKVAEEIALDHLAETPEYYNRLHDEVSMYDQDHVDRLQATIDAQAIKITDQATQIATTLEEAKESKSVAFNDAVEARMELVMKARQLFTKVETKGKTDVEIKRLVVADSYQGSVTLADQSDAYVEVLFDMAYDNHIEEFGASDLQLVLNDEASKTLDVNNTQPVISPQEAARQRAIKRNEHEES